MCCGLFFCLCAWQFWSSLIWGCKNYWQTRPTHLFLFGHTHSVGLVACPLGVLASKTTSPEVSQPSVSLNFFQSLLVFTEVAVETIVQDWQYFPSFMSCLSKNQSGTLHWCEFCTVVGTRSISSSVSSPTLLARSTSAFLNTTQAYLSLAPLTAVTAKAVCCRSSVWVLSTCRMCCSFSGISTDSEARRPPVEET